MANPTTKVPVTILSGQLGSGKSTLLRRILTEQSQFKIAIVMNEFAQTAKIEGKAIQLTVANEGTQVQEWLELDNGCLCCSAQDQGVLAIESLMQRRGTFDYVIIETTGIADPSQIAILFWLDSALESVLYLDGIVTVVDCLNLEKQLKEEASENSGTVTKQIAVADCLYLSKTDLVSGSTLTQTRRLLQGINTSALINESHEDLGLTLSRMLNVDSFSTFRRIPQALHISGNSSEAVTAELTDRLKPQVGQLIERNFRTAHNGFSSITIDLPTIDCVDKSDSQFDITFRRLLWEGRIGNEEIPDFNKDSDEPRILRAKGLLKDGNGNWFILQGVRDTYEIQPIEDVIDEQPKLVLIGKDLNYQMKEQFLNEIAQSGVPK
ncbi:hypothetical protein O181_000277 [Austropuccinia psidii MF-1]|uniref:CobW C-terminal domain-containing protein n=1 Tax=Austropuccinia psidii MF-1 TaxID=1389203 RepID=A0A9Q3B8J6_9BASI|nr:hypothetical protein [Austropuccinia psidii MF-1]